MEINNVNTAARSVGGLAQISSLSRVERSMDGKSEGDVAKSFESLFASMLVKEMRRSLPDGFFGEGTAADVYGGWLDETIGEAIAKSSALQLSHKVHASLEQKPAELEREAEPARETESA